MKTLKPITLLLTLLAASCAQVPPGAVIPNTKRLTFTMRVAGQVNPNFVYIVALRPSTQLNPTDQGPIPVAAPPWGNGFVAGNCSYFVQWDPNNSDYILNQFTDPSLNNFFPFGVPISFINPSGASNTLQFTIDLSQIAPSVDVANSYQSIQVNFLNQDVVPTGLGGSKTWDALGDERIPSQVNTWVTIPLRSSQTYTNAGTGNIEPVGDCVDPNLDIADWSVQVQVQ